MWSIHLLDLHKACSGSSADNADERADLERFGVQVDSWDERHRQIADPYMRKAWSGNCQGLRTGMQMPSRVDRLFRVLQSTTSVTYLLGKLSVARWGMDISEVISSTRADADLGAFTADVDFEEKTNEFQTTASIGAMRRRIESTSNDIMSSKPLACLFAWAANYSTKVTLSANTVGLIGFYERYGFELVDPRVETLKALRLMNDRKLELAGHEEKKGVAPPGSVDKEKAKTEYNDAKFAEVNAQMMLSERGRELLKSTCHPLVDYLGPTSG